MKTKKTQNKTTATGELACVDGVWMIYSTQKTGRGADAQMVIVTEELESFLVERMEKM